jgi:sugar lactone lactonase YvrE
MINLSSLNDRHCHHKPLSGDVAAVRCKVGENPIWNAIRNCLYWTDIPGGKIYRYSPISGRCETIYQGTPVGGFTMQEDNSLLLFLEQGGIARYDDGKIDYLVESLEEEFNTRFNDVIADPEGRVFCGTMPTPTRDGRLYRLEVDGRLTKILEGVRCSNGMAFSPDFQYFYYTDSYAYEVYEFKYSRSTGELSCKRAFIKGKETDGYPDGLVRDQEGYFWSARWGSGCVIRYTPEGAEFGRLELPVKLVTSLAFGGPDLNELYITTASDASNAGGENGALFRFQTNFRGVTEFRSKVRF